MVTIRRPFHLGGAGRRKTFGLGSEAGFTLAELIVAIIVIGIMVISISELFLGINRSQRQTSHIEAATRAGVQKIESLRNTNYILIPDGTVINFASELPEAIPNPRTASVTVSEPAADLRQLEVLISFPDGQATREVRLTAIVGNLGVVE